GYAELRRHELEDIEAHLTGVLGNPIGIRGRGARWARVRLRLERRRREDEPRGDYDKTRFHAVSLFDDYPASPTPDATHRPGPHAFRLRAGHDGFNVSRGREHYHSDPHVEGPEHLVPRDSTSGHQLMEKVWNAPRTGVDLGIEMFG